MPLGKLSWRHIQDLYDAVRDSSYAVQVQAVVSGPVKLAVREGVIGRNVADGLVCRALTARCTSTPAAWTPEYLVDSSMGCAVTGCSRSSGRRSIPACACPS